MAWNEGFGIGLAEGKQKIKEDIDIAYWQGYNNALVDVGEQEENE